MKHNTLKSVVVVLGIDLAKKSFQAHGVDKHGEVVLTKKLTQTRLAAFITQLSVCLM